MIKKIISSLLRKFGNVFSVEQDHKNQKKKVDSLLKDDFNWKNYHRIYGKQLSELSEIHTQILSHDDYIFKNNELTLNQNILPLHPNHRLLYETIFQLSPNSVMEIGCGWGDHLYNISLLNPTIELNGIDLSDKQISNLRKRHPDLRADIKQLDITLPYPFSYPICDIAFTQAVIMHLKVGNSHLIALSNMFKCATKQLVIMENWTAHNFYEDIQFLFSKGMIPWKNIYYYYRESVELKKTHLIVVSAIPLNNYPILSDYSILLV